MSGRARSSRALVIAAAALAAAGPSPASAQDPATLRAEAREILSEPRFRGSEVPRPFERPLESLGDHISRALRRIEAFMNSLGADVPGGPPVLWLILLALAVAAVALLTRREVRRRAARARLRAAEEAAPVREDPDVLEADAQTAEAAGNFEAAVRLRFRAGLLRLGERGVIAYRPSLTTGEVRAALGLDEFDHLGETFDAVAYGGRRAGEEDAAGARRGWDRVLAEAAR